MVLGIPILGLVGFFSLVQSKEPDDRGDVPGLLEKLASSAPDVREAADKLLRSKGPGLVPILRRFLESKPEAEVKVRVGLIIGDLLVQEARSLASKGKLDEAILKLAESEGAEDCAAYATKKLATIGKEVRAWYPRGDRLVGTVSRATEDAQKIWSTHGLWGLKFLMEELGSPNRATRIPVGELLEALGTPALPSLVKALGSENRVLQSGACIVLYSWATHPRKPEFTQEWLDAANRLSEDDRVDEGTRRDAKEMVRLIKEEMSWKKKSSPPPPK